MARAADLAEPAGRAQRLNLIKQLRLGLSSTYYSMAHTLGLRQLQDYLQVKAAPPAYPPCQSGRLMAAPVRNTALDVSLAPSQAGRPLPSLNTLLQTASRSVLATSGARAVMEHKSADQQPRTPDGLLTSGARARPRSPHQPSRSGCWAPATRTPSRRRGRRTAAALRWIRRRAPAPRRACTFLEPEHAQTALGARRCRCWRQCGATLSPASG